MQNEQLIIFVKEFMVKSGHILNDVKEDLVVRRSQGDGLFLTFKTPEIALSVAINIQQMMQNINWEQKDLPSALNARFALDAGPCYSFTDPISGNTDLAGLNVIRAARLEPVTPVGHIYASEAFMAMAEANGLKANFELAGQVGLPKNYGEMRVYHVH